MSDQAKQLGDQKALSKLKNRGGKGQEGIGMINGSILTLRENAAVSIAKQVIDDAKRGTGKALKDITIMDFAKYAQGRADNRPCSDANVLTEIVRLQNHEIYGNQLSRM